MGLLILLGIFALCVVIGMPVAFALGVAAVSAFFYEGLPMMIAFQRIISGISIFALMAIPFFIFAGELMFHGGIAMRLVRFASSAVGAVRGGLGIVNVFSSMLFGGISGSAIADISALGSILIPVMKEKGYDDDYAVNVTVTSSLAGIIIPPSHNMIIICGGGRRRNFHFQIVSCRICSRRLDVPVSCCRFLYCCGKAGLYFRGLSRVC